ncbi:aldehyde dehydrogenase family protein [Reichenbachiella ulvae]|uniref:Aldehyde dehydrogenase n=1 Tax=Reichenbachiella ulvae TaxID=2980104 RepID=A0ABT3D046_9BACT|nr:aldehyde dehydrogenase family protein [Reichenbachiella ulvae]MCV9389130.1 aldehyde dehydrogenase family protein [Reichenbachiella ulvae]
MLDTLDQLFEQQKEKALQMRSAPIAARKKNLKVLLRWLDENKQRIRDAVYQDLHKPETDIDISEIFPISNEIKHALRHLNAWTRPKAVSPGLTYLGTKSHIQYEPKGRCLIIAPWNFPFQLLCSPLVSCLAAGNTAILKPSEHTPHTAALIEDMIKELFDPSFVTVVQGGIPETQALLKLPFDHIFFTGSTPVGKIVMEAAAKNLSSVTLELGGKSPVIIDQTANLEDAAKKIVWGKFTNNGQTCIAPDYVFVAEGRESAFIATLKKHMERMFDSESKGFQNSSEYSRIVHQNHTQKQIDMMQEAQSKGAQVVAGGSYDIKERFLEPTLMTSIPEDCQLWKEEIFGPIIPIKTYSDISEVIDHINENDKPLSLYLFSKDKKLQKKITKETSAGTMVINDVVLQYAHPNLPFGGVNHSGIGKSHGYYGFMEFTNQKSVLRQRVGLTNASLFYPPFTSFKKKLVNWLIKYL